MTTTSTLLQASRSFLVLRKVRTEPLWARVAAVVAMSLLVAMLMMLVSALLMAQAKLEWWTGNLASSLIVGTCVAAAIVLLRRAVELALPARWLSQFSAVQGWRPMAAMSVLLVAGAALGICVRYGVLGWMIGADMWTKMSGVPILQLKFGIFLLAIVLGNGLWWRMRMKEHALAQQAAESQLRMLQAQIEPHFLFNTLANVQSLIASDAPRAQQMLESFTDYLRATLAQLRSGDSTLGAELETAHSYLLLMQIRMGSRLAFSIDADAASRRAVMPPLLLQPLVENAIHHGLEPQVDGGSVTVRAVVSDGMLTVQVSDDGAGLEAPRRASRSGTGMALANIRARLQTRHGERAALVLERAGAATRATLSLPYQPSA